MPAKNIARVAKEGTYSHIYNRGIEKRVIFNEAEDYETFLGFLKDYLSAPRDLKSTKKEFTVNGQIFRGVPHQPKNYFNKVELIAYSLMPDHFHLLLSQKTTGSIESFMRSLCTRYSMYFNKKNKRNGALFEGPYKSVHIKDVSALLFLTRYLHNSPKEGSKELTKGYSSYQEYLGVRKTLWVKPNVVLSLIDKRKEGYKDFVEKYVLTQRENEALEEIILESQSEHLERRVPTIDVEETTSPELVYEPLLKLPQFLAAAVGVFLLLLTLGIRHIHASTIDISLKPSPTPLVLSTKTEEVKPKIKVKVISKITDGSASVNIRQKPAIDSQKIGEAKDGDIFEFVSIDSGWYEVKLSDESTGFISATYMEVMGENK